MSYKIVVNEINAVKEVETLTPVKLTQFVNFKS